MPKTDTLIPSMSHRATAVVTTLLFLVSALVCAVANGAPADAAGADLLVRKVTYQGRTLTLRLQKVTVRSPGYRVQVEQADGSLKTYTPAAERAYLGSVDGESGAMASGVIASDGVFLGRVTFDRGATWDVTGEAVTATRGVDAPAAYKWPASGDPTLNRSTSPGEVGSTTYGWEIGYDVDSRWFGAAPVSGSLAKAVDQVDLSVVSMLDVYESNALLRPSVRRLVIRSSSAKDPYVGQETSESLSTVKAEWLRRFSDAGVDVVSMLTAAHAGAGLAAVGSVGETDRGYAVNGGAGASFFVQRHELGHTWGVRDNHTGSPEGSTIDSGNQYHRFDGTELSRIMRHRDFQLSGRTVPFPALGRFTTPLPPYAALDLIDHPVGSVSLRPAANDHDANGDALTLNNVVSTSKLGGRITRAGDVVTYAPPAVKETAVDWATYEIRDSSGKTATGVMLFRIDPSSVAPSADTWQTRSPRPNPSGYLLVNRSSGLGATVPAASATRQFPVQRAGSDATARWAFTLTGSGLRVVNRATGMCLGIDNGSTALGARTVHNTCNDSNDQRWRVAVHPDGGSALVNLRTGGCLTPRGGSTAREEQVVQEACGRSSAQSWDLRLPPMSTWPRSVAPSGPQELIQARSGLRAGTAAGAGLSARIVQRTRSAQTPLDLLVGADKSWRLRQTVSGTCWNDEGNAHRYVVLWSCSAPNSGFQVLQHPWGGVVIVGAAGECVGTENESTTAGAALSLEPCAEAEDNQRWLVLPAGR